MGTLSLIVAALNIFMAGIQFATWIDKRQTESLIWSVVNTMVGIYCLIAGVGGVVKTALGG